MTEPDPGSTRADILDTIRHFPGIHMRGIVNELDISTSLAQYHLTALKDEGLVRSAESGGFVRYFPVEEFRSLTEAERDQLAVLRRERPLEIALALLELGPMQHNELLEVVGGSKGTLSYHLRTLQDVELVVKVPRGDDRGFHLADADHLRRLLAQYEPAGDIVDRVHDTWEDLFGGHRHGE